MEIHVLRNLIFRYGAEIGLKSTEKEILWHLLDFDHNGKGFSFPAESTIAKRMGLVERQVRRLLCQLKEEQLISWKQTGRSNRYYYHGIMKVAAKWLRSETKKVVKKLAKNPDQLDLLPQNPQKADRTKMSGLSGHFSQAERTKMSGLSGQKCPPNTIKNSSKNSSKNSGEKSSIPQRYQMEFDHWKVEQGIPIFETEFEEPPLFNGTDAKEFARLRHDGKQLDEITERYKKYVKTQNNWYATNGYSFAVFAKNYSSFNGKIMARQSETKGNGANGSTGDRTLDVYLSAMRGAKMAEEMRRQANAKS